MAITGSSRLPGGRMLVRPCFQPTCQGLVSFVSARSKRAGEPARLWAECPACDQLQYLDEEGEQGPATRTG